MADSNSITLYVMSQKGYSVVQTLSDKGLLGKGDVVVVGRDKNVANDFAEDIISLCKRQQITIQERVDHEKFETKFAMAIGWRWLIPNTDNLIVLHDSLLPKYRGFLPLVSALLNKEKEVGVTALFANDYYDSGDIIAQATTNLSYPIKIQQVINLVQLNYQQLANEIISKIKAGETLNAVPQDHDQASYSLWRDEKDYLIDWNQSAKEIQSFIYAVGSPYAGASTYVDGQLIRILDAEIFPDKDIINRDVGKVIFMERKKPVIVCGKGLLKLTYVVDENGENFLPLKSFRSRFQSIS